MPLYLVLLLSLGELLAVLLIVRLVVFDHPPRRPQVLISMGEALDAENKADVLLERTIGLQAWKQYHVTGFIEVQSRRKPERTYKIHPTGTQMWEGDRFYGSICVHVAEDENLPRGDQLVILYLIAKYREDHLMRVGNVTYHEAF